MSNALEAKAIPEDVMQAAESCYAECEQMDSYGIVETIAKAILAERERSQWLPMDSAPTDGTPFAAFRRWPSGMVDIHVYAYEGHPNYWHCKSQGTCIRPDYQTEYLWAPLPPTQVEI